MIGLKYLRRIVDQYGHADAADLAETQLVTLAADEPYRLWTDQTEMYSIEAKLLAVKKGYALLLRKEGHNMSIVVDSLSLDDRQYVYNLYGASAQKH